MLRLVVLMANLVERSILQKVVKTVDKLLKGNTRLISRRELSWVELSEDNHWQQITRLDLIPRQQTEQTIEVLIMSIRLQLSLLTPTHKVSKSWVLQTKMLSVSPSILQTHTASLMSKDSHSTPQTNKAKPNSTRFKCLVKQLRGKQPHLTAGGWIQLTITTRAALTLLNTLLAMSTFTTNGLGWCMASLQTK